ncbi:chymotrypsin family serine protease [Hymenobacter metallicola]|uniref:Serine protease n=1 Tax=Hymenobacter metallicola TaxID=2563114 RepID=A0A4Z0QBL2_9BACT|nr:hypothetical protein [Hymenobacter metallicola]TGE26451.1 hypothetical protein E5K02_16795 [Hymenobacter metallicola]
MNPKNEEVKQLIKQILGKKADKLSASELQELSACFLEGGRQALMALNGTTKQAAAALNYAQELRNNARRQFARKSTKPTQATFSTPEWQRIQHILDANYDKLATWPGVLGSSPGFRICKSMPLTEKTATIYVQKKILSDKLPDTVLLPSVLSANGDEVSVDVVEVGEIQPQTLAGSSLGAGGPWGTLGTYAFDNQTNRIVALTAQHVASRMTNYSSPRPGTPNTAPLGRLLRGSREGTDAAAILVDSPPGFPFHIAGIGQVRGWRPVHDPADRNIGVRMHGAASGNLDGYIIAPRSTWYSPNYRNAILATTPTRGGDSGAALLDSNNFILGLLVGRADQYSLALFTPFNLVLSELGCSLPTA